MSKGKKAKDHTAGKMRKLGQVVRGLLQQHNSHKQSTKQSPPETILEIYPHYVASYMGTLIKG